MNDLQNRSMVITTSPIKANKNYTKSQMKDFKNLRHVITKSPEVKNQTSEETAMVPMETSAQKEDAYSSFVP